MTSLPRHCATLFWLVMPFLSGCIIPHNTLTGVTMKMSTEYNEDKSIKAVSCSVETPEPSLIEQVIGGATKLLGIL